MSPAKSKGQGRKSKMKLKQHGQYYHQNQPYVDPHIYKRTSKKQKSSEFHDECMDPATLEAHVEAATAAASAAVAAEMANSNHSNLNSNVYSSSKTDQSPSRLLTSEVPILPDDYQMQSSPRDVDIGQVKQEDLQLFLESIPDFHHTNIVRGGRCVKSGYVHVVKGENYLRDMFYNTATTPQRNIIVVRETLYCNGRGNCLRACGGRGHCVEGCTRKSERVTGGHSCFFQVKLSMYSASIGTWRVKVQGSHNGPVVAWKNPINHKDEVGNRNLDFFSLDATHSVNSSGNDLITSQADAIPESVYLKPDCKPVTQGILNHDVDSVVNSVGNGDNIPNCKTEVQNTNNSSYQLTCDGSCQAELKKLRQENTSLKLEILQLRHADGFKLLEDLKELIEKYETNDSLPTTPTSPAMYLMKVKNRDNEYVTITQP
ncbi:uncharacterized protein LOC115219172 isoform X2 [Octopus sinensis]|uniref:Uncharacterized protein LOC115219172 isoform X2 n=1 Tax=Octopus sinensis TaxID=2607531 RepID=A0A7E6FBA1_9MOLL|nr:uncharacterized protein LOC115219172 isoform X2 [Octopus sinensis]